MCVCVFFTLLLDHGWKLSGANLGIEIGTTTTTKWEKKTKNKRKKGHLTQVLLLLERTSTTLDWAVANWRIPLKY